MVARYKQVYDLFGTVYGRGPMIWLGMAKNQTLLMWAGGATFLARYGVSPSLIQAQGWWSSDAFLIYIHKNPALLIDLITSPWYHQLIIFFLSTIPPHIVLSHLSPFFSSPFFFPPLPLKKKKKKNLIALPVCSQYSILLLLGFRRP